MMERQQCSEGEKKQKIVHERGQHTEEERKRKRLHDHKKRRRIKSKVVRDLSSEFQAQSPNDSAIGSTSATDMEQQHDIVTSYDPCPKPCLEPPIQNEGLPMNPVWEIAQKETNALKMKYWTEKKERWTKFGYGSEPEIHQAINPKENPCEFEADAEDVIKNKLGVVERYAVGMYTKELKERERSAIRLARMYRNKFEDSQAEKTSIKMAAIRKEQEQRQFYRNSIQEGSTRAGLMLKLAKAQAQARSSS